MVAFMILMAALLTKHSVVPMFKMTVVTFRTKENEACHLTLLDTHLHFMKISLRYLLINMPDLT